MTTLHTPRRAAALLLAAAMALGLSNHAAAREHPERSASWEDYNKKIVLQMTSRMIGNTDAESLGHFFSPQLIQHDPTLANGRNAMVAAIVAMRQVTPALTLTVKHVLADRDKVFVHSHLSATPANEMSGTNRYDTYRLDHGVIVEHWSLVGKAPTRSANGNSEFSNLYTYSTPPAPLSQQRVEFNRMLAVNLSEDVYSKREFELLDRMWAVNYVQHNPHVANGRAALAGAMPYIAPEGNIYQVYNSMADGDLALVCAHGNDPGMNPKDEFSGWAVWDLYRVVDYQLVEHWDVAQFTPSSTASGNSMFSSLYRGNGR